MFEEISNRFLKSFFFSRDKQPFFEKKS